MTTTVTATYLDPSNNPCTGRVVFRLVAATYQDGIDAIFPTVPVTGVLDTLGAISVELEPTSGVDASFDAADMTYQVTERINGTERDPYFVDIPSAAGVDLGVLATYDDPLTVRRLAIDVDLSSLGYATETNLAYAQRGLSVAAFGAVGDGVTDDADAINAALVALAGPGTVWMPRTGAPYMVTEPIVLDPGQRLVGEGISNTDDGVCIKAKAGFTGTAVLMSSSWTDDDWWHWGSVENLRVDCDAIAANGIAIYQMGETSVIRNVIVTDATAAAFYLTGAHAPATLDNCNGSGSAYGIKLTSHPSLTGNSGVVRLFGFSGDNHSSAMIYCDGAHQITALGVKQEGTAPYTYQFAGTSQNASLFATGYSNVTGTSLVRIDGVTNKPVITLAGYRWQGVTNIIDDQVTPRTLTAATFTQFAPLVLYNGNTLFGGETIMGQAQALKWRRNDNGSLVTVLDQPSDLTVRLKGVSGPGVRIDNSAGTKVATFGASSVNTLDLATNMVAARFTQALVASTLAVGGAVACDADLGNEFDVTLQANCSSLTIGNGVAGQVVTVTMIQDATGGRTIVWGTALKFAGGTAPTDTTLSTRTSVTFRKSGSNWYELSRAVAVAA